MIATGQARQNIDPHLEATADRIWPPVAWEIDLLERMADGRADRAECGMRGAVTGIRGPGSEDRGARTGER